MVTTAIPKELVTQVYTGMSPTKISLQTKCKMQKVLVPQALNSRMGWDQDVSLEMARPERVREGWRGIHAGKRLQTERDAGRSLFSILGHRSLTRPSLILNRTENACVARVALSPRSWRHFLLYVPRFWFQRRDYCSHRTAWHIILLVIGLHYFCNSRQKEGPANPFVVIHI